MKRYKSKTVWTSTLSLVLIILGNLGLYKKIGITQENMKIIVDSGLSILVILGILNDPTKENK